MTDSRYRLTTVECPNPRRVLTTGPREARIELSRIASIVMLVTVLHSTMAIASDIVGVASVTDGDTIQIHGQSIRFYGIDAPESGQLCKLDDKPWRCGPAAANALADHIGARTVTCAPRDRDRYGRTVAVYRVEGEDVNAWLVREGWALAYRRYSSDYVDEEAAAKAAKRGLWRGTFIPP